LYTDIIGVSCDTIESHQEWLKIPRDEGGVLGLKFPIFADVETKVAAD